MSYFCDSIRYDKYIIEEKYFNNYNGAVVLPLIEIYNKEEVVFDFSNVKISCSNDNLSEVKINKIFIDYGDNTSEILNESLVSKNSSIGDFLNKSWKETSHKFNSEVKHVYKDIQNISSYPHITIICYNQYNDRFLFVIPYKFLYKSFYDEGSDLSLMDANINNRNITSFTLRERKNNSIVVISSKDFNEEIFEIKDPVVHIDSSDDYYVDDEDMVWNWSTYPKIDIDVKTPIYNISEEKWEVEIDWREKIVNIDKLKLRRIQVGNENVEKIWDLSKFTSRPFRDLVDNGIYKYTFIITGINELTTEQDVYVKCQSTLPSSVFIPGDKSVVEDVINSEKFYVSFSFKNNVITSFDMFEKFDIHLLNVDNLLDFRYDVLNQKFKDKKETYSFEITTDVIPDGKYKIYLDVKDKCGGSTSSFLDLYEKPVEEILTTVSYTIGKFSNIKVNKSSFDLIESGTKTEEIVDINGETVDIEWSFVDTNDENKSGNSEFFNVYLKQL